MALLAERRGGAALDLEAGRRGSSRRLGGGRTRRDRGIWVERLEREVNRAVRAKRPGSPIFRKTVGSPGFSRSA